MKIVSPICHPLPLVEPHVKYVYAPPHPAVLCLGRADGLMEVWDLLRGQSCPVQTLQVTDTAVTSLEFDPAQQGQVGAEEAG